ncbi:MAG: glycerate kinase [Methanobacteriota archaeon]
MISNREELLKGEYKGDRESLLNFLEAGLEFVLPANLFKENISYEGGVLKVSDLSYDLEKFEKVYVVGFGKASGFMALSLEEIFGDEIDDGVVVVKDRIEGLRNIEVVCGSHPVPDEKSVEASKKVLRFLEKAGENDLVICLVSGGGSALLSCPAEGINLGELTQTSKLLLNSGANISEVNTVRKHISQVKGGCLLKKVFPATILSLIISDVSGNRLDVIASGPLVPDDSTFREAVSVLKKHTIWYKVPDSVREHLECGVKCTIPETPKRGDDIFSKTENVIIADNWTAINAVKDKAQELGFTTVVPSDLFTGDVYEVAKEHLVLIEEIQSNPSIGKPACLITGGESTVKVCGKGCGGRSQQFMLSIAKGIPGKNVVAAAIDTDGVDGLSDAAGAIADGDTIARAEEEGLDSQRFLRENDSHTFFEKLGDTIKTGETGTNVNEVRIIICL